MPNYTNNLRRLGYSDEDFDGGGSDRLVQPFAPGDGEELISGHSFTRQRSSLCHRHKIHVDAANYCNTRHCACPFAEGNRSPRRNVSVR